MSRTKADQKVAVYLKDAADAQAKLRKVLDREDRSKEYAQCKSRRKTLKEIRARGFDLSKKLSQARADECGASCFCPTPRIAKTRLMSHIPQGGCRFCFPILYVVLSKYVVNGVCIFPYVYIKKKPCGFVSPAFLFALTLAK